MKLGRWIHTKQLVEDKALPLFTEHIKRTELSDESRIAPASSRDVTRRSKPS